MNSFGDNLTGNLEVCCGEKGHSYASSIYSRYPLRYVMTQGQDTLPLFRMNVVGFKGGSASDEPVNTRWSIGENATAVVSQGLSKISSSAVCTERNYVTNLASNSLLVHTPEPTVLGDGANLQQKQSYVLESSSSLVALDWFTLSGDKEWSLNSQINVVLDGEQIFNEIIEHSNNEVTENIGVFGTILLYGPQTEVVREMASDLIQRASLSVTVSKLPFLSVQGRPDEIYTNAKRSRLNSNDNLSMLRVAAKDVNAALSFVSELLKPLEEILGFVPFADKVRYFPFSFGIEVTPSKPLPAFSETKLTKLALPIVSPAPTNGFSFFEHDRQKDVSSDCKIQFTNLVSPSVDHYQSQMTF